MISDIELCNQLGFESRWLDHVDSYSLIRRDGSIEEGYVYAYKDQTKAFGNKSWVQVDNRGNITRISTIK